MAATGKKRKSEGNVASGSARRPKVADAAAVPTDGNSIRYELTHFLFNILTRDTETYVCGGGTSNNQAAKALCAILKHTSRDFQM
jgi:hypothetical protein